MQTVAIVGVGLIGGSFALALREAGFQGHILGVSSPETIRAALDVGAIDAAVSLEAAASEANLIYLAQPISRILGSITRLAPLLKPDTLVTDAGSTKSQIVSLARSTISNSCYLGGHPMAGKENRGVGFADPKLFQSRTYFVCPGEPADLQRPSVIEFIEWIRKIGAVPVTITAEEHDNLVAFTSHLAQLSSTALAATLAGVFDPDHARTAAGPGLGDMTRLALSSWEIWQDILATNPLAIDRALGLYIEELQQLRRDVQSGNVAGHFELAEKFTKRLRKQA